LCDVRNASLWLLLPCSVSTESDRDDDDDDDFVDRRTVRRSFQSHRASYRLLSNIGVSEGCSVAAIGLLLPSTNCLLTYLLTVFDLPPLA